MKPTKLRDRQLASLALKQIIEHPETWDQRRSHSNKHGMVCVTRCGTKHCFHGWVQKLLGLQENMHAFADTMKPLKISREAALDLNYPYNTIEDLKRLCKTIFGIKQIKLSTGKIMKL
jgi:hypothetical protein